MTKPKKLLLAAAVGLAVGAVALVLFWRPIAVALMSRHAAREFERVFSSDDAARHSMSLEEWAWRFGGRAGLPRLEALAKDPSLKPIGRTTAARLRDMIAGGRHLPHLRPVIDAMKGIRKDIQPPPWPTSALLKYIYERDSK